MKAILKVLLFSLVLSMIFTTEHISKSIKLNESVSAFATQKKIKFYNLKLDNKPLNQDLLIDSKILSKKNIYESPIVMISPVNQIKII